jgi:hypothetical protein
MRNQKFTIDKIKFAIDSKTYYKALDLYEKKKVINFKRLGYYCSADVLGTSNYKVKVSVFHFEEGECNCYLGQQDIFCKHMVAVAIYSLFEGEPIPEQAKEVVSIPKSSGKVGELTQEGIKEIKMHITEAIRYIKPYNGPSRIWFTYQASLMEGSNRLATIISKLPICLNSADLIIKLMIRLDKKLVSGGVDDSDGTVGTLIENCVQVIIDFCKLDPQCKKAVKQLKGISSCFDWEEPLLNLISTK